MWWRRNPTTERTLGAFAYGLVIVDYRNHGNLLFEAPQFYGYVTKVCGFRY